MHLQGVHWRPRKCFAEIVISKQITGLKNKIPELRHDKFVILSQLKIILTQGNKSYPNKQLEGKIENKSCLKK